MDFEDYYPQDGLMESNVDSYAQRTILRYDNGQMQPCLDAIVQEHVVDVAINGRNYCLMTCSPWNIEELIVGWLYLKGFICDYSSIKSIHVDLERGYVNAILKSDLSSNKTLSDSPAQESDLELCEVHGQRLSAYESNWMPDANLTPVESTQQVTPATVNSLINLLEGRSRLFHQTGGVHSAVLSNGSGFDAWFEDIGRHSAMDKLAGWCLINEITAANKVILFSGRVPHEIIVKIIRLGCPVVISPGAPTNLSIELASRYGVTLIGFAKHEKFNVYTHCERIGSVVEALA